MSHAWIALNAVNGLGAVRFSKLLERFGSPEAVFAASPQQLVGEGLLSPAIAAQLHNPELHENARRQQQKATQLGVKVLTLNDKEYPCYLREIFAPPPVLFVLGNCSLFSHHAVAIVGSRSPTMYGKQAAGLITRELVQHNFVIVSGMARGIDTVAHETALENGGSTIAVLGCGIDTIYPRSNKALADRICASGLIISEFPFETAPEAFNFPRRNRIISGCSAAVVVVEAGERSGSLITARYALQQGRDVCAVPGPITSSLSRGTFNLIKDGATPVRSGHELAESLNVITFPDSALFQKPHHELTESIFTEEERQVYDALSDEPMCIDAIAEVQCKPVTDLFVVLLNLELKGLVQQCSGQQFMRI